MASDFSSLTQQTALIDTLTMFIPWVISLGAISGITYLLLGKSGRLAHREKSRIIRAGISVVVGLLLGLPVAQILIRLLII